MDTHAHTHTHTHQPGITPRREIDTLVHIARRVQGHALPDQSVTLNTLSSPFQMNRGIAVAVPGRAHQGGKRERAFMNVRSAPAHACLFYTTLKKSHSRDASFGGAVREDNN